MTEKRLRRVRSAGEDNTIPGGAQVFQRIYTRLGCQARPPHFIVEFYPYSNLVHTIRLRDGSLLTFAFPNVLITDGTAFPSVLEAAAAILLGRLYRRRAPREMIEAYRHYSVASRTHKRVMATRFKRGRRNQSGAAGAAHDFAPMFSTLNKKYFGGKLHRPRLGWSKRKLARAAGMFGSGPGSNCCERAAGSLGSAAIRGGICAVSRDAARATPNSRGRLRVAGA